MAGDSDDEWFEQKWAGLAADWEVVFGPVSGWSEVERAALELVEPRRGVKERDVRAVVVGQGRADAAVAELRSVLVACGLEVPMLAAKVDRLNRPIVAVGFVSAGEARLISAVLQAGLQALRIPPAAR